MVGGPYAHGSSGETGRTEEGTDFFTNNRHLWYEAEPAVDYSASIICALAGYASLQGPITDCAVRTPLTGRAGDTSNLLSSGEPDTPGEAAPLPTTATPIATAPVAAAATPAPGPALAVQEPIDVKSSPPAAAAGPTAVAGGACGGGGQPVCAGEDLAGVP